jgi:hypothetical protein
MHKPAIGTRMKSRRDHGGRYKAGQVDLAALKATDGRSHQVDRGQACAIWAMFSPAKRGRNGFRGGKGFPYASFGFYERRASR